jgi:hypothetical protein
MKFWIINSFRTAVYTAFFAIIAYGVVFGVVNGGDVTSRIPGIDGDLAVALDVVVGLVGGWVVASLVCGLIVTFLDIRDDINDRLPDARRDV